MLINYLNIYESIQNSHLGARASLFQILDAVKAEHWFWDTEVLILENRRKLKMKEIPDKREERCKNNGQLA